MPRRGLRGSKSTSNRPQSAKPDSKRRCRAPTERVLGTDETTALENEYLIDGFDVEADKVLEPNDIKSNYDGAQKESSKLCDLEQSQAVVSVAEQKNLVMRRKKLLHLKQKLLPVPRWEESD